MFKFKNEKASACAQKILAAMKSGDEKQMQEAWAEFQTAIAEELKADFLEMQASNDVSILAQRGYRQLTSAETKWYNKVIDAMKSANPKQAFTALIGSGNEEDVMPTTIIEDVWNELTEEHELLGAIDFHYVGYITKWILNDHSTQTAVWGDITEEIVKEITSAFKTIDVTQKKLSAYAMVEKGMLDLGPTFLDRYIRACLSEALMCGMETAIVKGSGAKEPIGLIKDIHEGVAFSETTGYPDKVAIEVEDFTPVNYGNLVSQMATSEKGKKRTVKEVCLIVNSTDYLTKIMPATTVLTPEGKYVNNVFPIPTKVYISNAVDDGEAVMFLPKKYFLGAGGSKNGVIEYSDEYKFLEDMRVFKIKQYAMGRAYDNTVALRLDISNLKPTYITVRNFEETVTA